MALRVGLGYDVHRLVRGRPLFLGGVKILYPKGLLGHSDADVILHALVDALLGAAGMGDIGTRFPNHDPKWKNVCSLIFLREVSRTFSRKKIRVMNVDCMLHAEEPKIFPYIPRMKREISAALKIPENSIGIKASTNEGMGFVGRKAGMACTAVALVKT